MPDYSLSKIYQIICNTTGKRYIGATCQKKLCTRLAAHVSKKNMTTSRSIIDGGNYEMVLIESYPCESKDQLHQRERFHIQSMECVNKYIPGRTDKEYRHDNKAEISEKQKIYYQNNKAEISEKTKIYYQNNKAEILEKTKIYKQDNKAEISEKHKIYHQNNRAEISEKHKNYYQNNRETIKSKNRDRYQAKKQTPQEHRANRREYWANQKEINKVSLSPLE